MKIIPPTGHFVDEATSEIVDGRLPICALFTVTQKISSATNRRLRGQITSMICKRDATQVGNVWAWYYRVQWSDRRIDSGLYHESLLSPVNSKLSPMKTIAKKAPHKTVATTIQGSLTPKQKQILIMVATEGFKLQNPGISFNDWRHEQVMEAVQKPGLTACDQGDYSDLMGHFLTAAGRDDEALAWFLKNGKNAERQLAWKISKSLTDHTFLAHATVEQITASTSARSLRRRLAKREALQDHPDGPITYDYLVSIVRDKTRRPTLTLSPDLATSLADRCHISQLYQILYTLNNRIAEREGTGLISGRNKSQRSEAAKARRSPHEMAPRTRESD